MPLGREALGEFAARRVRRDQRGDVAQAQASAEHQDPRQDQLAVMMYVKYPLLLRNVEDLLHERGIDFSTVHASVHNHFNQERHLTSRETYKQNRSAALAEWRSLAA